MRRLLLVFLALLTLGASTRLCGDVYTPGSDMGGGVGGVLYDLTPSGNTTTPNYYHYDGRGDVVAQTDSSGGLGYQAAYTADGAHSAGQRFANGLIRLGMAPASFGAQESGGSYDTGNNLQANTKREELANGIDYVNDGQRYRDLFSGRFLTRDPAGYVDGTNEFNYVRDNPWTHWDPEGLDDTDASDQSGGWHPFQWIADHITVPILASPIIAWDHIVYGSSSNDASNDMINHFNGNPDTVAKVNNARGQAVTSLPAVASIPAFVPGTTLTGPAALPDSVGIAPATTAERNSTEVAAVNAATRDAAAATPTGGARAVVEGEVGTYGDLKARSVVGDGLDIHEVPSAAAQIAAKEAELGRELTPGEATALKNSNPAIVIRAETHALTDTYKGRNTPAQIAQDAANKAAAAARGAADVVKAGKATGVDLTDAAKQLQNMTPAAPATSN
jgi:RHS repeat-associated protein